MPRSSLLPSLPLSPSPEKSPPNPPWSVWSRRDRVEVWFDGLDGRDLEESLAVAAEIIAAGAWRSWMVRRFIRLHRHEVTRLMRRLGPMIPPSRGGPRFGPG